MNGMTFVRFDGAGAIRRRSKAGTDRHVGSTATQFLINGRFLYQRVTGVQRYAHQIVQSMDRCIDPARSSGEILAPPGRLPSIVLSNIGVRQTGFGRRLFWEQVALPMQRDLPLLNLCNTAPLFKRNNIVCIHDCNVFEMPESYSRLFRFYHGALLPLIVNGEAKITTVSRYSAEAIARRFGIKSSNITVCSNGFEHVASWDPNRSRFRQKTGAEQPYILLIGSLAKHKNLGCVVKLAEALATIGLSIKIVGAAASAFAHVVPPTAPNIEWLGKVTDDDLAYLLDHAICLAFPSFREGFGLPALEAMARGCPVVASNSSSLPEVCGLAALYADPHDSASWLQQFRLLKESASLRDELARNGHEQSRKFTWAAAAQTYLDLLRNAHG